MNAIALDARRTLLERRAALAKLARELDRDAQEMRETPQGDEADQAIHRQPLAVLESMRKGEIAEAGEIEAALARIEAGTYGMCEACGRAIGRQRLRAIPEARFCLACAARSSKAA